MKKGIKTLKRIFVVFLAVAMVMNTINLTGFVSHAEEGILPATEETVSDCTEADTEGDSVPEYALTEDEYEEESLAEDAENVQASEEETFFVEKTFEEIQTDVARISASGDDFLSIDGNGKVALKEGNYANWIDRLDLDGADYAVDFYEWLKTNSNPETCLSQPGKVALYDPEGNSTGEITREDFDNDGVNESYVYCIRTIEGTGTFVYNKETAAQDAYNAIAEELDANKQATYPYIPAVFFAFDRDCPEVFWLSGTCSYMSSYSYGYNTAGTVAYTQEFYLLLKSNTFDMREASYRNLTILDEAIENTLVGNTSGKKAILAGAESLGTRYEKVKYFNEWLTKHNCYNSDYVNAGNDAHECITALTGTSGTNGPVCEAYAKALKVLCDASGIPCVLVDGTAITDSGSGPHMWNYVRMDDNKWYGVDVTWNDPTTGSNAVVSGSEHENYLLVGSDTVIGSRTFIASHPVSNQVSESVAPFINGPILETESYEPPSNTPELTVAGEVVDTSKDSTGTGWSYDFETTTLTLTDNLTGNVVCDRSINIALGDPVTLTGNIEIENGDLVIGGTGHLTIGGTSTLKGNINVSNGSLTVNGTGSLKVNYKVTANEIKVSGSMHVVVARGVSVAPVVEGDCRLRNSSNTFGTSIGEITDTTFASYFESVDSEHELAISTVAKFKYIHRLSCTDTDCACALDNVWEYHTLDPENNYLCRTEGCNIGAVAYVSHTEAGVETQLPCFYFSNVTGNTTEYTRGVLDVIQPGDTIVLCQNVTTDSSSVMSFDTSGEYFIDLNGFTLNMKNKAFDLTDGSIVTVKGSGTYQLTNWDENIRGSEDFNGYITTSSDKKTRIYGTITLSSARTIPTGEIYDFIDGAKFVLNGYTVTENGTIQVNGVEHLHNSNEQVTYTITESGHAATTVCVDCPVEYKNVGSEEEHDYVYTKKGETISLDCSICKNGRGAWGLEAPDNLYYDGSIKAATVTGNITDVSAPEITYSGEGLVEGKPVDVGTYTAGIEVSGLSLQVTYTIKGNLATHANVAAIPNVTYDGTAKTPLPVVTMGNLTLVKDTDYTLSYEENINAGTACIVITGKGNYEGEKSVTFVIEKAAAPELIWPVADEGVYGQQLKDISFVSMETTYGTFAWENESEMLLYGSNAYTVVFTPSAHTLQNYEAVSVTEKEITVNAEQAEIKIESITAEDKIFDKSNVVTISNIQISGVVGADDVSIDVSQLVATVSSADANTYDKVYPAGLKLAGRNKDYYKLEDVSDGISAQVTIHKAPAEILIEEGKDSYSKTFGEEEFLLEGISFTGEGALSYSVGNGKNLFGTADKDAASILKVSEAGVVTILGTGKATITVDAASSSNYEVAAPKTIEVTILYSGIIHMDEVGEVTYTGSAIKPEINVYDGSTEVVLQKGKDYTITYKNNVNAYTLEEGEEGFDAKKAPQIIIKGKGNYSAVITAYFTIAPKDISDPEDTSILADDVLTEYNGKVQKKVPVITYNKKKLAGVAKPEDGSMPAKLKDFVYSYPDLADENAYKNAGTWEIIVEGTGNYTGSRSVNLIIAAKGGKMTAAKVKPIPAQEYNDGNPVILDATELVVTAKVNGVQTTLVEGEHFETTYKNNKKVGTASVTLTALEGSGLAGSKTVTFKIVGTSLKKAKVEGLENVTYNGKAQTLNLKVTMPDGTVLVKDRDYEVSYSKNSNAGTAKVTVKGTGAYTDSVTKSFKILAYNMSGETDAAGNLKADSLLTEVNGLLAMKNGELSVKFTKGGAMPAVELVFDGVTLQAGKDYTLAYKNNKNVYTLVEGEAGYKANKAPLITVKGKGNFTGSFTKTFVITGRGLSDSEVGVIMTADDKAASTKPGGYISKPVIKDADGKALQQGKDYTVPVYTMTGADGEDVILGAKDVVGTVGAEITVTVKGLGNYAVEEDEGLSYTYRLTAKSISSVKVTGIEVPYSSTSKAYLTRDDFYNADGTSKVTIGSGKNKEYLDFEEDFEIVPGSYQKNDKKGTATVTIKGINEYGGTKTIKFKVGTRTLGDWDWWPFR
ncbi:MAG: hypothetical protein IJ291_00650 [Lachnospiraceae bacterium]|nr:hypothetical protein [Lachnospiraceae bacterium]